MMFPVRWLMWAPVAFNAFLVVLAADSFWAGVKSVDVTRCLAMAGLLAVAFASMAACYLVAIGKCEP